MNGLVIRKDTSTGRYRWLCVHTNSMKDLDNELIPSVAHMEMVEAVNSGAFPMPPLFICHNEKWKIGQTDVMACDEVAPGVVFVVASGLFDEGMEIVAERLKNVSSAMSHGLRVLGTGEFNGARVLSPYRTVEISVLPEGIALPANPRTYYLVEDSMGIREDIQRSKLGQLLGLETVEAIEAANADIAAKALSDGVVYKDATDETENGAVEAVEETVEEVTVEDAVENEQEADSDPAYATVADLEALASLIGDAIKNLHDDLKGEQEALRKDLAAQVAQVSAAVADANDRIEKAHQESVTPAAARPGFEALLKSMTRSGVSPDEPQTEATPPEETKSRRIQNGPLGYLAAMVEN